MYEYCPQGSDRAAWLQLQYTQQRNVLYHLNQEWVFMVSSRVVNGPPDGATAIPMWVTQTGHSQFQQGEGVAIPVRCTGTTINQHRVCAECQPVERTILPPFISVTDYQYSDWMVSDALGAGNKDIFPPSRRARETAT